MGSILMTRTRRFVIPCSYPWLIFTVLLRQIELAERMVPILGTLYRKKNVVVHFLGRGLVNK